MSANIKFLSDFIFLNFQRTHDRIDIYRFPNRKIKSDKNRYLLTLFSLIWFTIQKRRGKIQTGEYHVHQGLSKVFVFYTYSTSHFYMVCQNSWMILVFPIQIFWTLVVFTIQFFWQLCFDRFFVCFIARILNFCLECYFQEILTGVIVFTKVLRHARSQSPLTHWVLRPLQKLLCTHIYILR